jgi:hypothetical protein
MAIARFAGWFSSPLGQSAMLTWIAIFVGPPLLEIYGQRHWGWKPLGQLFTWLQADWLLIGLFCGVPVVGVVSFLLALNQKLPGTSSSRRSVARGFLIEPASTAPNP